MQRLMPIQAYTSPCHCHELTYQDVQIDRKPWQSLHVICVRKLDKRSSIDTEQDEFRHACITCSCNPCLQSGKCAPAQELLVAAEPQGVKPAIKYCFLNGLTEPDAGTKASLQTPSPVVSWERAVQVVWHLLDSRVPQLPVCCCLAADSLTDGLHSVGTITQMTFRKADFLIG